jgi:butyryl-CoA dehydrogenase
MAYRTVGMIDAALAGIDPALAHESKEIQKRIEEYAVECSILKVWGSEMLDTIVDHVVQIYAGYGYVEEYPAERAYRDSRINRIFEGTNEINRLIITGFLLKRAMSGQLPLLPAINKLMDEVMAPPSFGESGDEVDDPLAHEAGLLVAAKKIALFTAGAASQKYMTGLADQQEIMADIADITMEVYALESALLRARKVGGSSMAVTMTQLYAAHAFGVIEQAARRIVAAVAEGDTLRIQLAILRRLAKHEPANTVELGRGIAAQVLHSGQYNL